jgi:hypothetical protein
MRLNTTYTTAEKIARAVSKLLSDLHLDLDMVGYYIYHSMPPLVYNRFQEIAHAAEHEKKMIEDENFRRKMHEIGIY